MRFYISLYSQVSKSHSITFLDADGVRFLVLLSFRCSVRERHDLPDRTKIWTKKPHDIHLHLLYRRLRFSHVCESIRNSVEALTERQQPIFASVDLRFRHRGHRLHIDSDELLQQGFKPVFN